MLLFKKPFWEGLTSGAITLTFRRWQKAHVRVGGRYRCHPIGVLEVDRVDRVRADAITPEDARRAGFTDVPAVIAYLEELGPLAAGDELWRVELHHGGDGDRVELALVAELSADDLAQIRERLARLDRNGPTDGPKQPWTAKTLALIDKHPRIAASKLAPKLGRETQPFKTDVRKLKKLGLTQSFEVGYEISPRGRAYLSAAKGRVPRRAASKRGASKTDAAYPPARRSRSLRSRV
jgi:hypothetical protein